MLLVAFVLYLAATTSSQRLYCSEQSSNSATFQKADDLGSYTAELCMKMNRNVTDWSVDLLFTENAQHCNNSHHMRRPGKIHSTLKLDSINQIINNCTFACLSTNFEMIFKSCYEIKSMLYKDGNSSPPYDTYHNITNNFTRDSFDKVPKVIVFKHEKDISIYFYAAAPISSFEAELCDLNATVAKVCPRVTKNCTMMENNVEIRCFLEPSYGYYKLWLNLNAPWNNGPFYYLSTLSHDFYFQKVTPNGLSGSDWSVAWLCGALVLISGAALLVWRLRDAIALHKRVLRYWTELGQESRASTSARTDVPCKHILLVYGREGTIAEPLWRGIKETLKSTGAQVYDVFDAETMALAARAPGDWIRGMMARQDCRMVVVQTPAMACLYPAPSNNPDSPLPVSQPLLGGRALYRVPQFGDSLAQFALRLLAHSTAQPHNHNDQYHLPAYKKYYLATLTDLPTEVFPQVCPFRRYCLPGALPLLVEHLESDGGTPLSPTTMQTVEQAAEHFVVHARENPDYLLEELVFT